MFGTRYGNVLTVILVIVIILILGLVGWFAYDMYKQSSTNNIAQSAIDDFNNNIRKRVEDKAIEGNTELDPGNTSRDNSTILGNKKTYLENYEVKGIIEIPKTGIKYPILSQVTKRSLELAVAILYPTGGDLNEVGNTVILGHNYRNSLFFSDNDKISNGDKILITDQTGRTVTYEVYRKFETDPNDSDYITRDTENRREISLSTCTDDSKSRIVILAKEKEDSKTETNQTTEENVDEEQ